jgi:hypothetical protein
MKAESKITRLLLVSPWSLLIFLIIPLLVILSVTLHIRLPLFESTTPLLVNNLCFAFIAAGRLFRYLAGLRRSCRYGAAYGVPRRSVHHSLSAESVRVLLGRAGYSFTADGSYGEKQDIGYLGTTVLYGGLLILLATGSLDNLQRFSGVLLDGMGPATSLDKLETYRSISKGPLAPNKLSLPKMQILNQFLPDSTNPKGATEIALIPADGKVQNFVLRPRDPVSYGTFDIYMAKLVFEPQIVIKTRDGKTLFDSFVKLDPLVQKRGVYSFYGLFQGNDVGGGVYYQPEKSSLMVVISRGGRKVVADMVFQVDQQAVQGEYILSCAKMGQWSEIHIVKRRHKSLLLAGAVIAVIGLLLRIAFRPQRVWLEETAAGSTLRVSGRETEKLLQADKPVEG